MNVQDVSAPKLKHESASVMNKDTAPSTNNEKSTGHKDFPTEGYSVENKSTAPNSNNKSMPSKKSA